MRGIVEPKFAADERDALTAGGDPEDGANASLSEREFSLISAQCDRLEALAEQGRASADRDPCRQQLVDAGWRQPGRHGGLHPARPDRRGQRRGSLREIVRSDRYASGW